MGLFVTLGINDSSSMGEIEILSLSAEPIIFFFTLFKFGTGKNLKAVLAEFSILS
jgi:hypothetical protein